MIAGSKGDVYGSEAPKPQLVAPAWHIALFVTFVLAISFAGAMQSHHGGSLPSKRPSTFVVYTSVVRQNLAGPVPTKNSIVQRLRLKRQRENRVARLAN